MKPVRQCLFLCLLFLFNIVNAATYYANSSTGSDSYAGTSSSAPFKTFTKAYTTASAGDVIILTGTFTGTDASETASTTTNGFTISKALTIQGSSSTTLAVVQAGSSSSSTTSRAVFSIEANVTLKNLEVRYGYTTYGGACYEYPNYTLTLENCYLHDNYTTTKGGALFASSCSVTITNCTFANNTSAGQSGGIELTTSASAVITNSTFYNNKATGGVGGVMTISSTTTCVITNCTLAGNTASTYGGGIEMSNYSGTLTIKNTIVANNSAGSDANTNDLDLYTGALVDNGYNIFEYYEITSATGSISSNTKTGNQTNLFGSSVSATPALASNSTLNGTPTLALASGSVAVDAGSSTANGSVSIPTTDQRGASRNGTTDIGAYEYNGALPVELTSFTATTASSNETALYWKTATEVNNYGFEVERRVVSGSSLSGYSWSKIGFVAGNGTSSNAHTYSYTDNNVSAGTYVYRLKQIDNDGTYKYSSEAQITIAVPTVFALGQNYPNPFNPSTVIGYQLLVRGSVSLKVYDIIGREVATLVNETKEAGSYQVTFNASKLASGVYFYRLQSGSYSSVKKLVLMK